MIWTWQLLRFSCVCAVCMCEDKGPRLALLRTDGNISLCSTHSLFRLPSHKACVYYVFLFNLSELCIAKRYQETLSPKVFWVSESQQVYMVGPARWILNLKVSLPSPSLLCTTVLGHEWVGPTVNLGNNRSILTSSFACILWNSTTRSTYTLFIALPHILPTVNFSVISRFSDFSELSKDTHLRGI